MAESEFESRMVWPQSSHSSLEDTSTDVLCSLCGCQTIRTFKSQMRSCLWEPFEKCLVLCRCKVSRLTFFVTPNYSGDITNNHIGGFKYGSSVGVPCGVSPWYDEMRGRPVQKKHRSWWLNPDWLYNGDVVFCPHIYFQSEFVNTTSPIF